MEPVKPAAPVTPAPAAPVAPAVAPTAKPTPASSVPPAAVRPAAPIPASPAPAQSAQTVPLPELLEERTKRQGLEKQMQDMQNELLAMKRVAPAPIQQQPQDEYRKQLEQLWETDPRKAVQTEIMAAMSWYDGVQYKIDSQEHSLSAKYSDFNGYRNEVRSYVRSLPIEQRQQDGIVELAYYAVKGQKSDDIMGTMRKQWEAEFFSKLQSGEISAVPPSGAVTAPYVPTTVLATDEEKRVAEIMGMSVEDYLKHKR